MMRILAAAALGAAALAGCSPQFYVANVYQHQGLVYVQRCQLDNRDKPDPSTCTISVADEPPPGTPLVPPTPPAPPAAAAR